MHDQKNIKNTFMYKFSLVYCSILFSSMTIEMHTNGEKVTSFVSSGSYKSWSGGREKGWHHLHAPYMFFLSYLPLLRWRRFRVTSLGRLSTKCIVVSTAQTPAVCCFVVWCKKWFWFVRSAPYGWNGSRSVSKMIIWLPKLLVSKYKCMQMNTHFGKIFEILHYGNCGDMVLSVAMFIVELVSSCVANRAKHKHDGSDISLS